MSEFTHARCGGVLVEIAPPSWDRSGDIYAQCVKCRLPGILETGGGYRRMFRPDEADEIRREFWASDRSRVAFALDLGVSESTLDHILARTGAYRG